MNDVDELKAEWFEFGRKSGIKETEERIIKLLEDDSAGYCSCKWGINELDSGELVDVQEFTCDPHRYIALIKGEK